MSKKIFIFGAGSGGRDVLRIIDDINEKLPTWDVIGFVDKNPELISQKIDGYQVYAFQDLQASKDYYGICGIMDPQFRREIVIKEIETKGYKLPAIIHPAISHSSDFKASSGTVIFAGVHLSYNIQLGKSVLVSPNTVLGHDLRVGEYSSIMPAATISGKCKIGESCLIGSGAILSQGITVGNKSLVGVGTTVIKDISDKTSAIDFPRKVIREDF